MTRIKIKNLVKFSIILLLILFMFHLTRLFMAIYFSNHNNIANITFHDIPIGATNGEWTALAVAEGIGVHENIEQLVSSVSYIIRGEIIDQKERGVGIGLPADRMIAYVYSFYLIRVTEVFAGGIEVGDIIEVSQRKSTRRPTTPYRRPHTGVIQTEYIRLPLQIGDDLILFLNFVESFTTDFGESINSMTNIWTFNRIQGIYRYAPADIRDMYDNWVFENVNEHNNLVLTESTLQHIIETKKDAP